MAKATAVSFAQLLTQAVYRIRHRESKSVQVVQDELGYALGKKGGASIEYWRKGHVPAKASDLEKLMHILVMRGGFSFDWATKFLDSARYPYTDSFLTQLFPTTLTSTPTTSCSSPKKIRTNLPVQPTPFLGRQREMAAIIKRLDDPNCRILTLVGPGGIGKTRLALQAAKQRMQNFVDGVFFVSLVTLNTLQLALSSIANIVQFSFVEGVPQKTQLLNFFRDKKLLLVVDNFEHLIEEATLISEIIQQAPHVQILLTSRERLNLRGEWVYTVKGMEYPPKSECESSPGILNIKKDADIGKFSAVQLFARSARRVRSDFSLKKADKRQIVRICQLVKGVPLAIELAATWVRLLSCAEIAQEIERNYEFLATNWRDIPPRHRSLQTVFDYSWDLLSPDEQNALGRLSVFQGSFCRKEATETAGVSLLMVSALMDKSFLHGVMVEEGETAVSHYEMHELLRLYVIEKQK